MPTPPVAVTGVKAVAAIDCVRVLVATATVVISSGAVIVKLNVLLDCAPLASVAVTVKLLAAINVVGVPVIAPVEVLNDNPAGSDGLIA